MNPALKGFAFIVSGVGCLIGGLYYLTKSAASVPDTPLDKLATVEAIPPQPAPLEKPPEPANSAEPAESVTQE